MTLADFLNFFLGILTIVAQVASLILVAVLLFPSSKSLFSGPVNFVSKNALWLSFTVAFIATAGSLLFSDVVGYEPCKLCWFQRIFIYPQVLLLGISAWKKEKTMKIYGIILSSIGAVIALYHYLGQIGFTTLPCPATGYSVSCAKVFTLEFGYITIPMMALSAFIFILLMLIVSLKHAEVTQ